MLELAPTDPIIKAYLRDLSQLKRQGVSHELGLTAPFQTLLDKAAKKRGWMLVPELSTYSGGKRVVPDGTVRDEFRLARGWWGAKDTARSLLKTDFLSSSAPMAPCEQAASSEDCHRLFGEIFRGNLQSSLTAERRLQRAVFEVGVRTVNGDS
jgi:hypothetical protein